MAFIKLSLDKTSKARYNRKASFSKSRSGKSRNFRKKTEVGTSKRFTKSSLDKTEKM
jgi:hypothetical protein